MIGGLIYNSMTFMILPLYVSLEKIDPRLLEASKDLYSSAFRAFRKVILPLSLPGVIAGSLLVFIPAVGDFINADYLGSTTDHDDRQRHPEAVPGGQGLSGARPR